MGKRVGWGNDEDKEEDDDDWDKNDMAHVLNYSDSDDCDNYNDGDDD